MYRTSVMNVVERNRCPPTRTRSPHTIHLLRRVRGICEAVVGGGMIAVVAVVVVVVFKPT
jgi:hypothetical protein